MVYFIVRRLAASVITIFFLIVGLFVLQNIIPADPARAMLGPEATEEAVRAMEVKLGLDQPVLIQFGRYLWRLSHLDLGTSNWDRQPVLDAIIRYAPASIELALVATVLSFSLGLLFGIYAAAHHGRAGATLARFLAIGGRALPAFWLALLLQILLYGKLGWFPNGARLDLVAASEPAHVTGLYLLDSILALDFGTFKSALHHLTLPALAIAVSGVAEIQRMTTAMMLIEMRRDYARTAHAKGLHGRTVLYRHVARNALNPVLTIVGVRFGYLLAGTVLIETIFRWPGIGRYALLSIENLDFPAIMGVTFFVALTFAVVNFIVDISYGYLDPRVRYG